MAKKRLTTADWVCRLNKLGGEIDETADSVHPSAWQEVLEPLWEKYRALAAQPTEDRVQVALFEKEEFE